MGKLEIDQGDKKGAQGQHHPEGTAPPADLGEGAAEHRAGKLGDHPNRLGERQRALSPRRREPGDDKRQTGAVKQPATEPLDHARGIEDRDVRGQRAAHGADQEHRRAQGNSVAPPKRRPYGSDTGRADDRTDGIEHGRPGVIGRAADIGHHRRHDDGDHQDLDGMKGGGEDDEPANHAVGSPQQIAPGTGLRLLLRRVHARCRRFL